MLMGTIAVRIFKFPSWITPATCFNNTTALPLLLIQSLSSTGVLDRLLMSESDTASEALVRAKSYFLVNAIVGNSLTFALGPRLLDGEESPNDEHQEDEQRENGHTSPGEGGAESEQEDGQPSNGDAERGEEQPDEQTSLLPDPVVQREEQVYKITSYHAQKQWSHLHPLVRNFFDFSYAFLNAPLIGAVIGAIIGLVPPFHRVFFNEPQEGGFFKAWLTESVQDVGGLFAALQVVVVGVKLSGALRKMKKGEDSGSVPWAPMLFNIGVRFVLWPM